MRIEDVYYKEVFEYTPARALWHLSKLMEQMAHRPKGLYHVRQWPSIVIEKHFERDEIMALVQARLHFIDRGRVERSQGDDPHIALYGFEAITHDYRTQDSVGAPLQGQRNKGEAYGPGLSGRGRWLRITEFLFDAGRWARWWRTLHRSIGIGREKEVVDHSQARKLREYLVDFHTLPGVNTATMHEGIRQFLELLDR